MFTKLAPQSVQSSEGFIVQSFDRYHIEYIAKDIRGMVEVDNGRSTGIYKDTLKLMALDGSEVFHSEENKKEIISRIAAGLEAMGCEVEIC